MDSFNKHLIMKNALLRAHVWAMMKLGKYGLGPKFSLYAKHVDGRYIIGEAWRKGEPWGLFRKSHPIQQYCAPSPEGFFNTTYAPKTIVHKGHTYDVPFQNAGVSSKFTLTYPFKVEVAVTYRQTHPDMWDAPLWLSGVKSWPPEIDVAEVWGKHWAPNLHWNEKANLKKSLHFKGYKHKIKPGTQYIWSVDAGLKYTKFYINGHLLRVVRTPKEILDTPMYIVVNSGAKNAYPKEDRANFLLHRIIYQQS